MTPSRTRRAGHTVSTLAVAASSLTLITLAAPAAQAAPSAPSCVVAGNAIACTVTYSYAGAEETFTVPAGVTALGVTAVGATGGHYTSSPVPGRGAVVTGGLTTAPGNTFYVAVGQTGGYTPSGNYGPVFNGGGTAGNDSGSGGGATDLRTLSRAGDPSASLGSRVIVAGGGGGNDASGSGGNAGLNGQTPATVGTSGTPGQGGTQSAGGAGGVSNTGSSNGTAGTLGQGGTGGVIGGGGGGGLYGGGGGGTLQGGGGGSSLVPTGGAVSVNTTGQAPHLDLTYSRPVTAISAITPANATTTAGTGVTYGITVTDGYVSVQGNATGLAIFPNGPGTGATCTATSCVATKAGTYQITATSNGFEKTTTLTVGAGALAATSLTPATSTVKAGTGVGFTVSGTDAFGNAVAVAPGASTVKVTPAGGGSPVTCAAQTCSVQQAGSYVVSSSTPKPGGGTLSASAALTVVAGPVASLAVSPDGASTTAGTPVDFTALAFDQYGNPITGQDVSFSYSDGGHQVVCPDGACAPTSAGDHTVTARALPGGGQPAVTAVVTLTVVPAGVAALSVSPEDATTTAGEPVQYAVSGVDEFGNALPDQTADSTVVYTPTAGGDPVVCEDASCAPTVAGVYQVEVSQDGDDAPMGDATTLTVKPAALDHTSVTPVELLATAGDLVTFTVTGFDAYDNEVGDVTGDSSVQLVGAESGTLTCARGVCRPTTADSYEVHSHTPLSGEGSATSDATLLVVPSSLDHLKVTPGVAQTRTGVTKAYTAVGYDEFGNSLGDLTEATDFTLTPLGEGESIACDGADCTAWVAGSYQVEGSSDGATGTAALNVLATRASIQVDPGHLTHGLTFGDDVPVVAQVTSPDEVVPTGQVQFSLDGVEIGEPVVLDEDGRATLPDLTDVGAGLHTLTAVFGSVPDGAYTLSTSETAFVVAKAPTTTHVSVTATSITATVDAAGLPKPTGSVQFSLNGHDLGRVEVVEGTAVLTTDTTVAPGAAVQATYLGTENYAVSSGSTARQDPKVTASLSTAGGATPVGGWYRTPVTVTFACTAGSAAVTCPAPVVLDHEGAGQTVSRTVVAADGGLATVTAGPVNIDLTAPVAKVVGVTDGASFNGPAPAVTCQGGDVLSGLATCSVTTTGSFPGTMTSTATAVDVAGNTSSTTVTYVTRDLWVGKAVPVKGAWPVKIGKSVSLLVASQHKPTLGGKLARPTDTFRWAGYRNGTARWAALVRMPADAKVGQVVVYEVKVEGVTRKVRLKAVS